MSQYFRTVFNCLVTIVLHFSLSWSDTFSVVILVRCFLFIAYFGINVQEGSGGLSLPLGIAAAAGLGLLAFQEVRLTIPSQTAFFLSFDLAFSVTKFVL